MRGSTITSFTTIIPYAYRPTFWKAPGLARRKRGIGKTVGIIALV